MRWSVDKVNTVRFSVAIATLVGIGILPCVSLLRLRETTQQVRQARQVLTQAEVVGSRIKDAETGQRGYLLTGEATYLQPYYTGINLTSVALDELARRLAEDPRQQERLVNLRSSINAKLAELRQTIDLRQKYGLSAALKVVKTNQGKRLMEQITTVLDTIKTEQQVLLDQRSANEQRNGALTVLVTLGSIGLQLSLVTGIVLGLNRESKNLQRSKTDLLRSEQRYRSLVTATAQVVWIADASGELLNVSPTWQTITGQPEAEAQGWGWLRLVHPDNRDTVRQVWLSAVTQQTLYEAEYRLQLPSDTGDRDFLVRAVPVLEDDGSIREWVGTYVDITERKQADRFLKESRNLLEARVQQRTQELAETNQELQAEVAERKQIEHQLEQAATRLRQSNQELEQFAYVASHDLQEPLRTVASYTQLLAKKYQGNLDEKADKYINYVVDGATRMQQLINDLLTYSRVGKQNLDLTLVDCNQIIQQVRTLLQTAIAESKATIVVEPLPQVMADTSRLTQLFQNLIGNAIKYRSEVAPIIRIAATERSEEWVFSISDNGIGIDPQYRERIFVIFQRLHTRRSYTGTGIGLAICKKIVELHQGQIWVESEPNRGSTFYFSLSRSYTPTTPLLEAST